MIFFILTFSTEYLRVWLKHLGKLGQVEAVMWLLFLGCISGGFMLIIAAI
jgi:hypothetical protein